MHSKYAVPLVSYGIPPAKEGNDTEVPVDITYWSDEYIDITLLDGRDESISVHKSQVELLALLLRTITEEVDK